MIYFISESQRRTLKTSPNGKIHTHTRCRAQLEILVDGLLSFSKETFAFPQPAKWEKNAAARAWESRETEASKDGISK